LVLFALCTVLQESTHVQAQKFRNASQLPLARRGPQVRVRFLDANLGMRPPIGSHKSVWSHR